MLNAQSPRWSIAWSCDIPGMLKFASVAGNMRSDEAKIGGMVPAVFTRSGRCAVCPP